MKCKLNWETEEDGRISFSEGEREIMVLKVFATGEDEAELAIERMESKEQAEACIRRGFELLWEEGFEELVLVEKRNSKTEELLRSLPDLKYVYSEYMMRKKIKGSDCEETEMSLRIVEEPSGYICRNREGSLFGRLLLHPQENNLYLYEFEVEESMRNQGVGTMGLRQLLKDLSEWEEAPEYLLLQVGSYNEPALHLYRKLGFEITEELCYYILREEEELEWDE